MGIFTNNLDSVFFIYGLAFFVLGLSVFLSPRKESSIFKLSNIIWLFGAFGLIHGITGLDMFTIIKGYNSLAWLNLKFIALASSFFFIFEFGRRLVNLNSKKRILNKWVTVIPCLAVILCVFIFKNIPPDIWPRYLLALPGSLLAASGFWAYYSGNENVLGKLRVKKYFFALALAVGTYGLLGGLVNSINSDTFSKAVGLPVQVFRAGCAVIMAWSGWKILGIFTQEVRQELNNQLKLTQNQLFQLKKMEIIGELASGVAHEVRNPLAIILQGAEFLKDTLAGSSNENVRMTLKYIEDAVRRADNVIKGLLDFSRLTKFNADPEDLNEIIKNALLLMKTRLDQGGIETAVKLQEGLPRIKLDKSRVEQVFVNLIMNALQAMPNGGKLNVASSLHSGPDGKQWLLARIEDSGPGIPEDILEKVFIPFFTTKRGMGGIGLGIPIVKNIVDMHGGKFEIENRHGACGVRASVMFTVGGGKNGEEKDPDR
jgi:signal transduction histidine kinase